MNRLLLLSLLTGVIMLFSVSGCANKDNSVQPTPVPVPQSIAIQQQKPAFLKDGTYTGQGDSWKYGSESATVTVKNGKITDITLHRLDQQGKEINYDQWTGTEMNEITGAYKLNLKQIRKDFANKMVQNQTYQVDTIAGATLSTMNWKTSVQRALDKASQ